MIQLRNRSSPYSHIVQAFNYDFFNSFYSIYPTEFVVLFSFCECFDHPNIFLERIQIKGIVVFGKYKKKKKERKNSNSPTICLSGQILGLCARKVFF